MTDNDRNFLIDVASVEKLQTVEAEEDKIKDIIKDNYDYLAPFIDSLYYIEANIIYLNYVQGVPQEIIGNIFQITQYGVSKRIVSALKRLAIYMSIPDKDTSDSYHFLKKLIPNSEATAITMFYSLKTVHTVSRVLRASNITVTKVKETVTKNLEELQDISEPLEFKRYILNIKPSIEIDEEFMSRISEEEGFFLVVRHTINTHIQYLKALNEYNSRGSHNFRKEWH